MDPLVNPKHFRGAQSDDSRFKRLQLQIEALAKRVDLLQRLVDSHENAMAKRGPGRPPKDQAA